MHLEQDDGIVFQTIFVQCVEVDHIVWIVCVFPILATVSWSKKDHEITLYGRKEFESFLSGLFPILRIQELIHSRHSGWNDLFVRYTELFRKKGRNIFGTGNSIGILTMAAKRTRAAKMSPSAVSNTLKSGAGMPDLNQFCFFI